MIHDRKWFNDMESAIPCGDTVRTRFAPSPTGYMHVGGLRTALYAYLIAKKSGGVFILRIEDTDTSRYVEGAAEIIKNTLRGAGLNYDEGPDIGGPAAPYTQSERKSVYRPYAELLCEKGFAYYCFCSRGEESGGGADFTGEPQTPSADPCRFLSYEESKSRANGGEAYAIRMKAPADGFTTVSDLVFGDVTTPNKDLDDMVLLKRDGMPTYNFANVIDDHLMGITHVLRGSEYISSAPKYNLLYEAFGWTVPLYITVSPVMRDARHKLSKRHGDPTYDDLLRLGYLPDAVLNYIALLGWSPGGEREIYSLEELTEAFSIEGISKAPAIFDLEKLKYFNSEYIRAMTPAAFAEAARPYIRQAVKNETYPADEIASILQSRCEILSDIPEKVDFFDAAAEYTADLFVHKKSKTDEVISLQMLRAAYASLLAPEDFSHAAIHDNFIALAEKLGVKNATLMWPVRVAVSGKAVTPGGAVEICHILGRDETLRRIALGIMKLGGYVADE